MTPFCGSLPSILFEAYRKLALAKHPDRGGDPEDFARVSKAYEAGFSARRATRDARRRVWGVVAVGCGRPKEPWVVVLWGEAAETQGGVGPRRGPKRHGLGSGICPFYHLFSIGKSRGVGARYD